MSNARENIASRSSMREVLFSLITRDVFCPIGNVNNNRIKNKKSNADKAKISVYPGKIIPTANQAAIKITLTIKDIDAARISFSKMDEMPKPAIKSQSAMPVIIKNIDITSFGYRAS